MDIKRKDAGFKKPSSMWINCGGRTTHVPVGKGSGMTHTASEKISWKQLEEEG